MKTSKIIIKKKHCYKLSVNENLNKMWKKDPYMRALKRKKFPSRPVEDVFIKVLSTFRRMKSKEFVYHKYRILNILDKVIPHEYFGSTENRKRFYHLVNKITTQSRFEYVPNSVLSEGYNFEVIDWLRRENLSKNKEKRLLYKANFYLLKYVVKPIIRHFYYPLKSSCSYKITFIERGKWHSFNQRNLNKLLTSDYIIPSHLPHDFHCRGMLRLYPKKNCYNLEYRPIVCPHKIDKKKKLYFKTLSKQINKLALEFSSISTGSLFNKWKDYIEKIDDKKIFGIKMDIKDAFGNVNVRKVYEIIDSSTLFNNADKEFIKNHISNQFICYNRKLYKWTHGILQGDKLSPSICNLFISYQEYESKLGIFRENCFLSRYVDDYLFCSVNFINIETFENKIKEYFFLNEAKTEKVDFTNSKVEINYQGQIFNLQSKEVSKFYKLGKHDSIRYKFNFWSSKSPKTRLNLISRTLRFPFNNHCFKKFELNTSFNSERTVLKNYFEGMIYIAHKFDACVKSSANFKETANEMNLLSTVKSTINIYATIVFSIIKKLKGKYFSGNISFRLITNIGYIAFKLVLKRSYKFYSDIINYINNMNLYLKFDDIDTKMFGKLPEAFNNIKINRKSMI